MPDPRDERQAISFMNRSQQTIATFYLILVCSEVKRLKNFLQNIIRNIGAVFAYSIVRKEELVPNLKRRLVNGIVEAQGK